MGARITQGRCTPAGKGIKCRSGAREAAFLQKPAACLKVAKTTQGVQVPNI